MSESRFTCPQCPTVDCPECEGEGEWESDTRAGMVGCYRCQTKGQVVSADFDLPGVLAHWRWHTQQAPPFSVLDHLGTETITHCERMSPAFTLTLIEATEQLLSDGPRLTAIGFATRLVVAAGFEQVTP